MLDSKKLVFAVAGAFLLGSLIFGLVGFYSRDSELAKNKIDPDYVWEMEQVDPMQIRDYLLELSSDPHMAGLERDELLAEFVAEQWRSAGLDLVKVEGYKMLLDYPDKKNPNLIKIHTESGELVFTSHYKEEGVDHPNFVDAFNAYSKPGTVEGVPVYVNHGGVEDFEKIKALNVDVTGKVCIAMYGNGFRGNKAENAANAGCAGLIIFSDPKDVAQNGTEPSQVYPNTFWLPGTGMQRGSLALSDGDPLTPNWPSLDNVYKLDEEDRKKYLPRIPVQPVGYADAEQILNKLGGEVAPEDWQGMIPGLEYRLGGEFSPEYQGAKLELSVHNKMEEKVSSNVIGILYGDVEPDKYVMLGNHRDAWGFGALDPSSGTAQLLEVVRVLGEKVKTGWRPRRTMIFLNWGAEEYSLCGSREFVEQYIKQMEQRGVAYINTDVCMSGPILLPSGSPTIANLLVEATKDIYSPDNDAESYYDFWKRWAEVPEGEEFKPEIIMSPGAGSDHATFIYLAGVPVIDIMFEHDPHKWKIGGYPAYHTGFETFKLVDEIYDPDFKMFRACSQLNLRLGLELADTPLLPYDFAPYADVMENAMQGLDKNGVISQINSLGIETKYLNASVYAFRDSVVAWKEYVAGLDTTNNPMTLRYVNDQMMGFEKTLLLSEGLPDRTQYRHAVIAPSLFDAYGGSAFPGLGDLLYNIDILGEEDRAKRIKTLKKHVSDLMIVAMRAAEFLRPVQVL